MFIHLSHEEKKRNACEPKSPKWALRTLLSAEQVGISTTSDSFICSFVSSSIEEVCRMYLHLLPFCLHVSLRCPHFLPACFLGVAKIICYHFSALLLHNVQNTTTFPNIPYLHRLIYYYYCNSVLILNEYFCCCCTIRIIY